MLTIGREALLKQLSAVKAGISPRDIVEQSSCFIFRDGKVVTFNEEIAVSQATDLKITGAINAGPLCSILEKLPDEHISCDVQDGELIIRGAKRRTGLRMDAQIVLPVDKVEQPGEWKPLHEDFAEAVNIVKLSAGKDASQFVTTCMHIHPKWVEACDNFQLCRYKIKTGVSEPFLVRATSIQEMIPLGMVEFSETPSWIHFRNGDGLVFSCRRHREDYPNLAPMFEVSGETIVLPKGLADAAKRAEVFSSENADATDVSIELSPGKLRLKGVGASGWYSETREVPYQGPTLSFSIKPDLIKEVVAKEAQVTAASIKVDGGKFVYAASLHIPEEKTSA